MRSIVAVFEKRGLDCGAVLRAAGLTRKQADDPDIRLSLDRIEAVWRTAAQASNDPFLALHAAETVPYGSYGILDFICEAAPTVDEALKRLCSYYPLMNNCAILTAESGRKECALYLGSHVGKLLPPMIEFIFSTIVIHTRLCWHMDWSPGRVEFPYPAPEDLSEYERIFRCSFKFEAPIARLAIPRDIWDSAIPTANPALLRLLDDHAAALLAVHPPPQDTEARVRSAIGPKLPSGEYCLESVAREMGFSPRNLQRHLKSIDRSFGQILDDMRAQTARYYLEDPDIPIGEVAGKIGYLGAGSFSRAFRRWTGLTPMQYRRKRQKPLTARMGRIS
ncbi:MAG: AraC family transcriptional regulator [Spirochaetales bacterium]|nr:AraC family transcriptional regulator [Spirochaetales bacterium]